MTTSSLKVATVSTYSFKFKINNYLPGDAKIELTFPQNEIDIPFQLLSSDLSITVYDRTKVSNLAYQFRKVRTITITNPLGGVALNPDASKFITLDVGKV